MEISIRAPINIAIIKYWGKSDVLNIHPTNDSISFTLNQEQISTTTFISAEPNTGQSILCLNGQLQSSLPPRMMDVIIIAQLKARLKGQPVIPHVRIESQNNFPTAAGLASSASGYSALASGLAKLYEIEDDVFELARHGSGSACRSLKGGCVAWLSTKNQSSIIPMYPASFWPELRILICVVNGDRKPLGSTQAMERTVKTSKLFQFGRIKSVKLNEKTLIESLKTRNFETFAEVAMRESDQLHALCLDTWPPSIFLSDGSRDIMHWVHTINRLLQRTLVAYSFDAGPNAFLFVQQNDVPLVLYLLAMCFGSDGPFRPSANSLEWALSVEFPTHPRQMRNLLISGLRYPSFSDTIPEDWIKELPRREGCVTRVISTEIGDGPQVLSPNNKP